MLSPRSRSASSMFTQSLCLPPPIPIEGFVLPLADLRYRSVVPCHTANFVKQPVAHSVLSLPLSESCSRLWGLKQRELTPKHYPQTNCFILYQLYSTGTYHVSVPLFRFHYTDPYGSGYTSLFQNKKVSKI